jgi:hypothetical protein
MQLIDNINRLLGDDLKGAIAHGGRLRVAASCFSIYAYAALKDELEQLDRFDFIFTAPTFTPEEVTDSGKKERREFHIPKANRSRSFYGTEFGIQLKEQAHPAGHRQGMRRLDAPQGPIQVQPE